MRGDDEDINLSPRDTAILKMRLEYPTVSVREIRDRLESEFDISLSHNRVNEILREMRDKGVFRQPTLPDESLLNFHLFRIAFHYPNFEQAWETCYWDLMDDPHVVMFFNADSYHHWQLITAFRDNEQTEQWIHEFFKKHGDLIDQFDNSALPTIHKNAIDADILDEILAETEEGRALLEQSSSATLEDSDKLAADGDD
jgi:hypothetical protein